MVFWIVDKATHTGPCHIKHHSPNQDRFAYFSDGDFIALVVADGAGSLELSHLGAELAVYTAIEVAKSSQPRKRPADLVKEMHGQVVSAFEVIPDRDVMGCTLAIAVADASEWAILLVGDSYAVVHTGDGAHQVIESPPAGEYANITKLITSVESEPLTKGGTSENLRGLSLATDGVAFGIQDNAALPAFWTPLLERVASGTKSYEKFLESLSDREVLWDDTTLVTAMIEGK